MTPSAVRALVVGLLFNVFDTINISILWSRTTLFQRVVDHQAAACCTRLTVVVLGWASG